MGFPFWLWCALLARMLVMSPSMAVNSTALPRAANDTVDTPASPQVVSRTRLLSESTATPFLRGSFPEDSIDSPKAVFYSLASACQLWTSSDL